MVSLFKTAENRTLTIAHRGGSSLAPENTLSAAQKAFEVGADMWELDLRMSADGELIVLHDNTLARTSNVRDIPEFRTRWPWQTHRFTLAELKELDAGSWYVKTDPHGQIQAGNVSEEDASGYCGEKIPSLAEALLFTRKKDYCVNIEIKDLSDHPGEKRVIEKLADMILELDMIDQVLVSSFHHDYLMKLKTEHPDICTAALVRTALPDPIGLLNRLKAAAFHVSQKVATPDVIEKVKAHGFSVNVYTVNEQRSIDYFKTIGASGIITDFPQRIKLSRA